MNIKYITLIFIGIFALLFAVMIIFGKKTYRYECQDPAKYHLSKCRPPLCEVSGICTQYLIEQEVKYEK